MSDEVAEASAQDTESKDRDERRHQIDDAIHRSSTDRDRVVLTLASGALAVSLAFIHDIAPTPKHWSLAVASWFAFSGSMISVLLSYVTAELHQRCALILHDCETMKENAPTWRRLGDPFFRRATHFLNSLAVAALLAGIIVLVVFAVKNAKGA